MVPCVTSHAYRLSPDTAPKTPSTTPSARHTTTTSTAPKDTPDSFQVIGQCLQSQGILGDTADIILNSWRHSTKKQYHSYIQRWLLFCTERQIITREASVNNLLAFLTKLYNGGLGYSGLNTAISAVSIFVELCAGPTGLSQHVLVKRFLRGVFVARPALPRYVVTWDVTILLNYFKSQVPLSRLTLLALSKKLAALLLLLSGHRCHSLYLLDIRNIRCSAGQLKIVFGDLLKQSRPGHHTQQLCLPAYLQNSKLCVVSTYLAYIQRTKVLRGKQTRLFIATIKPHQTVSKDTLSKWIKSVLALAGIDTSVFTAHSVRSAATSAARVPIASILRTAGWTSECTFRKFYKRPVSGHTDFASSLLQYADGTDTAD